MDLTLRRGASSRTVPSGVRYGEIQPPEFLRSLVARGIVHCWEAVAPSPDRSAKTHSNARVSGSASHCGSHVAAGAAGGTRVPCVPLSTQWGGFGGNERRTVRARCSGRPRDATSTGPRGRPTSLTLPLPGCCEVSQRVAGVNRRRDPKRYRVRDDSGSDSVRACATDRAPWKRYGVRCAASVWRCAAASASGTSSLWQP